MCTHRARTSLSARCAHVRALLTTTRAHANARARTRTRPRVSRPSRTRDARRSRACTRAHVDGACTRSNRARSFFRESCRQSGASLSTDRGWSHTAHVPRVPGPHATEPGHEARALLPGSPERIRTAASALRGRRPGPLDDGARWPDQRIRQLGGEDSNLQQQGQNLPCCRLHHPRMGRSRVRQTGCGSRASIATRAR